jgi:hypothetical protein
MLGTPTVGWHLNTPFADRQRQLVARTPRKRHAHVQARYRTQLRSQRHADPLTPARHVQPQFDHLPAGLACHRSCRECATFHLRSTRHRRVADPDQCRRREPPARIGGDVADIDRIDSDQTRIVLDERDRDPSGGFAVGINDGADQWLATLRRQARASHQNDKQQARYGVHGGRRW